MTLREPVMERAEEALITGEQLFAMPDVGPYELVEGRLVPLSPTGQVHGDCEAAFAELLRAHVRRHGLGFVRTGEVGIYTGRDPDTVRAADVLFISNERHSRAKSDRYLDVAPDLIVEVLSPSDPWSELMQKLHEYCTVGVRLVWVADPSTPTVTAFRSVTDVREFGASDVLPGDDVLPGFAVPVAELFES